MRVRNGIIGSFPRNRKALGLAQFRFYISALTVPVYFLVAWSLYRRGLWRSYLFFWLCILFEGAALAATVVTAGSTSMTLAVYRVSQPPMWILYVFMVVEVYQKVFARFPGIAKFARRVVIISILIAFAFALLSIQGDLSSGWNGYSMVARYSIILRAISGGISIYMILIAAFLLWMPVPLPANTLRHSYLFFFYFFVTTGVHYILFVNRGEFVQAANVVISILTLAVLLCWHFLLQPDGERIPSRLAPVPQGRAADMLDRLEALNRTLSRSQE